MLRVHEAYPEVRASASRLSALRVPALDGIRGIAVLMVLLHHLSGYLPQHSRPFSEAAAVLRNGWVGVDLFFVLSGFLITGILLDTKYAPNYFRSFYARRVLRIFPLYYIVLSAIGFAAALPYVGQWLRPILPISHDRLFYFVYLNNWWPLLKDTWHANIIGHFWSLAVEEQFYLLWPLCVWLLPRRKLPWVAAGGIALAILIRCGIYHYFGPTRSIVENTFARMDTLLMGALIAMLVRSPRALKILHPYLYSAAIASIAILLCFNALGGVPQYNEFYGVSVQFTLIAVVFSAIVLRAFTRRDDSTAVQTFLRRPLLGRVGKYSYGMYVYHVPIMLASAALLRHFVSRNFSAPVAVAFMMGIILLTYGVAKLSFDFLESRFLKQKKRFAPREPAHAD